MIELKDVRHKYTVIKLKKSNGKIRIIEAPNDELKQKQREHYLQYLRNLPVSKFAHGFAPRKNIVTNAIPHVGKKYVLKADIKNFFNSINFNHFCTIFYKNYLPLFPDINKDKGLEKENLLIHFINKPTETLTTYDFYLPQGGPASPFLSNIYLFKFDYYIAQFIRRLYEKDKILVNYTRYADDITLSSDSKKHIFKVLKFIEESVLKYSYPKLEFNNEKIKLLPYYTRQKVCGIVVNKKINLPRKLRKKLRAMKFQIKNGYKNETNRDRGYLAFEKMVYDSQKEVFDMSSYIARFNTKKFLQI